MKPIREKKQMTPTMVKSGVILKIKGLVERVSHILVSVVMKLISLLYVSQVGCQHLKYNFGITLKQKGILGNEEIAAFVAEIGYINAAPTG